MTLGPPGIGKTALCQAALVRAARAGMVVASARGAELEEGFAFGVARQLFEAQLDCVDPSERGRLLAGTAKGAEIALGDRPAQPPAGWLGDLAFPAIHGLHALMVNISRRTPLALVVDDLHWADRLSRRWLLYSASRLDAAAVAIVLAWRPEDEDDRSGELARLLELAGARVLRPAPLSAEATRTLLSRALARPPAQRLVETAVQVTGGNPLLVWELIRALRADGLGVDASAAERVLELGPQSLARSVTLRLARLSPEATELARAVAILGDGARLVDVAALAQLPQQAGARAAARLAAAGVLAPELPLRFVHPIVRRALYEDISAAERSAGHARAAALLAAAGAEPETVCAHLLRCEHLREGWRQSADPRERASIALDVAELEAIGGRWESAASTVNQALAELAACRRRGRHAREVAGRLESLWAGLAAYDPLLVGEFDRRTEGWLARVDAQEMPASLVALLAAVRVWRGEQVDGAQELLERLLARDVTELVEADTVAVSRTFGTLLMLERLECLQSLVEALLVVARRRNLLGAGELDDRLARSANGAMLSEVRGRLALAAQQRPTAREQLEAAAAVYQALRFYNPNASAWRSALALAIAGEDRARATLLAHAELRDARRLALARATGIALRTLGVIQGGEDGIERLRHACTVLGASGARLEHARALVELGAALRRSNRRAAAREPLLAALDLAHRCGAIRLQQRARVELLQAGARPRRVSLSGPEALTASERRVAQLAAQGLTNREIARALFVTINTVQSHLRHVFVKLGLSSRRQLAAALQEGYGGQWSGPRAGAVQKFTWTQ